MLVIQRLPVMVLQARDIHVDIPYLDSYVWSPLIHLKPLTTLRPASRNHKITQSHDSWTHTGYLQQGCQCSEADILVQKTPISAVSRNIGIPDTTKTRTDYIRQDSQFMWLTHCDCVNKLTVTLQLCKQPKD